VAKTKAPDMSWDGIRSWMVEYALAAARAHAAGEDSIVLGLYHPQQLNLKVGGYCARFVRQIVETASNEIPMAWDYARANARLMERALRSAGFYVGKVLECAEPGDIVGINLPASVEVGHIGIYVGEVDGVPMIAENTSVASRGKPRRKGTKLTPWSVMAERVTGLYRLRHLT
jgi:hypothetical protein